MLSTANNMFFAFDILKRFYISRGIDSFFLTGTDEHGLKIQKSAEKANLDPLKYCDDISEVFRELTKKLNLFSSLYLSSL